MIVIPLIGLPPPHLMSVLSQDLDF